MSTASGVSSTGATSASPPGGEASWVWQDISSRAAAAAVRARNNQFLRKNRSGGFGDGLVDAVERAFEQAPDHRLEKGERGAVIIGIERRLVIELAEARGILEMLMAAKRLTHVAVHSEVMEEIIAL